MAEDEGDWEYTPPDTSADDAGDWEYAEPPSQAGAFARSAAREVVPGAVGGVAGMSLMYPGAAGGFAIAGPPGALVGGAGGAILGGVAGGMAGKWLQDKFLDMIGAREGDGMFSHSSEEADKEAFPKTSFAGELVGGTLPSFGVGRAAMPIARGVGAALQGGMEAGQEAYNGEDFSPSKILMSGAAGAVAAQPRKWMNPITGPMERRFPLPESMGGKPATPKVVEDVPMAPDIEMALSEREQIREKFDEQVGQHELTEPPSRFEGDLNREFPEVPGSAGETRPVTPVDNEGAAGASLNAEFPKVPDSAGATRGMGAEHGVALDREFPQVPPEYRDASAGLSEAWEAHQKLPGNSVEDHQPPPPTPHEMTAANDVTTTAIGVAAENYPAPKLNVGNEVGAQMEARSAARPNDVRRNYTKGFQGTRDSDLGKPLGGKVKTFAVGELPDDIHAALTEAQPGTGEPSVTGAVTAPEAPPTAPGQTPAAQAAIAGQRPPLGLKNPTSATLTPEAMKLRRPVPAREAAPVERQPLPAPEGLPPAAKQPRILERVLSPDEQAKIDRAASLLSEPARITDLPPDAALAKAEQTLEAHSRISDNTRREASRPETSKGAKVASEADAKKIQSVNDAVKLAVQSMEHGARDLVPEGKSIEANKAKIIAHAQKLYDDAVLMNGGVDPIDRKVGYQASHEFREPAWNTVQQARRVIAKANAGNSKKAQEARAEYLARLESGGEASRDYETAAALDKHTTEFDDALHSQEKKNAKTEERTLPHQDGPGYDALRAYVDELSDTQWDRLSTAWDGQLGLDLHTTRRPEGLINKLQDVLDGIALPSKKMGWISAETSPMDEALDKLIQRLPRSIQVVFPGAHPDGFHGQFEPAGVIKIFDAALQDNPIATFRHEEVHALKELDLFKPHEWKILERNAPALDPGAEDWYRKYYADHGETQARVEERIKEERVASLFENYDHTEPTTFVGRLVARVKDFFEKLGNALRALDPKAFESVKSIIGKVESGEVGARFEKRQPWDAANAAHDEFMRDAYPEEFARLDKELTDITGGPVSPSMKDWMKELQDAWHRPALAQEFVDYAKGIARNFGTNQSEMAMFKRRVYQHIKDAKLPDGTKPTDAQYKAIQSALDRQGGVDALPVVLKDFTKTTLQSMLKEYTQKYDMARFIKTQYKLPGWDKMPDHTIKSDVGDEWFPRYQKGDTAFESGPMDVITGRSLHAASDTTKERGYFALHNAKTDERLVFAPQPGNKEIHILRNGAPQKVLIKGGIDPTKINEVIPMKVKGVTGDWTVTHAHNDEITLAAGKDVNGKNKVEYHNPMVAMANALHGITKELENAKSLKKLFDDPLFSANDFGKNPDRKDIAAKNLRETSLPPFKGHYFPQQIAWALDDFHSNGFFSDNEFKKALNDLSAGSAKIFYFFGPMVHAFNEANKWAIGRGFDWITPGGWKSLVLDGATAFKDSRSTNRPLEREMFEAGANLMLPHSITSNFLLKVGREIGVSIGKDPSKWDPIARAFGVSTGDIAERAYNLSTNSMWYLSDLMAKQMYLEGKRKGLSNEDAVKRMHNFVDSYQMPNVLWGAGKGGIQEASGRLVKQLLTDPSLSLFGPYHYGVFHTLAHMTKSLVGPDATKAQRVEAAGQFAVAAAMMYAVYPLLSAGYQQLTGNQHSEVEARGLTRLVNTGRDVVTGKKGVVDAARNAFTPSVVLDTAQRVSSGKNWQGKDIITKKDYTQHPVKNTLKTLGQAGEFAAGQFVSPYKTVSNAVQRPGSDPLTVVGHFVESMLGLKTPTPGAVKFDANSWKERMKEDKAHNKRPGGLIESGFNKTARNL